MGDLFRLLQEQGPEMRRRIKADVMLMDYHDQYLKTALWKRIKKRVLERDQKVCQCCGGSGSVVHHRSYSRDVMEGRNDSMLATVCAGCHDFIHFTDEGARRDEADVDAVLLAGQRQLTEIPPVGKIDLRRPNSSYPGDAKRVSSLRLRLYREAFLAAWRDKSAQRSRAVEKAADRRAVRIPSDPHAGS